MHNVIFRAVKFFRPDKIVFKNIYLYIPISMLCMLYFLVYLGQALCLWTKGVVHYAINSKDYDIHSQEIITGALSGIQKELCIKFFDTPPNYSATVENKILFINNPDKRKSCPPDFYNYTGSVVDMPIGYKCLNTKGVTRIVVDMLRASIEQTSAMTVNSYDLVRKFEEQAEDSSSSTLLTPAERNFINAHYHSECGALSLQHRLVTPARRFDYEGLRLSPENEAYYKDRLWPLGVVMYGVARKLQNSQHHKKLKYAMATLELASCIVFQEIEDDDVLRARSLLWFGAQGAEAPQQGFMEGNQTVSLASMAEGAPGHSAHTVNLLMRALGLPMQSNRHDRDYFVNVNWNNVQKGKEHYVEKTPSAAWLLNSDYPYDFDSVTHAPANYMCASCAHGETTFEPTQDHLWQRTMSMGHNTELTDGDKEMLQFLYSQPCQDRYMVQLK